MSVTNGQRANAENFNNAFMSRTSNTDTTGKVDLKDAGSTDVIDAQAVINQNITDIATNVASISQLDLDKQDISEKDFPNGYAGLDANGDVAIGAIPEDVKLNPNSAALLASQTGTDVTGLLFNSANVESATVFYSIKTATLFEKGQFDVIYDGTNWSKHTGLVSKDDSGITTDIVVGTGQITYTSGLETATMKWKYITLDI